MAPAAQAEPPFGVESFSSRTTDTNGAPYAVAGGHPDLNTTEFSLTLEGGDVGKSVEVLNSAYVRPPRGFIGNPAAAPRCPLSKIASSDSPQASDCPPGSRVGIAFTTVNNEGSPDHGSTITSLIYNLPPEYGYPAQFGFRAGFTPTVISVFPRPRTDSYGLTIGPPNTPAIGVTAFKSVLFGVPGQQPVTGPTDGSGGTNAPFLSNPLDCSEAEPTWSIAIDSAEHAGALVGLGVPDLSDPDWKTASELAPAVTECDDPLLANQFDPGIAVKPLQNPGPVQADQPAGLAVDLDFPQSNDPTDPNTNFDPTIPQTPEPKDVTVKLPAGLAISPSSSDGLGACSDLASDPAGDQVHYDNTKPVTCPAASKFGSATATSPLLATHDPITDEVNGAEPIPGDVYLLKPHPGDLPIGGESDGKFRLLIQLENPRYGINFKLPGIAVADKQTGQLTITFTDNPQLPAKHVTVNLKGGPWASLATPVTCGAFTTAANFVPWSTPGTPDANKATSFNVGSGPNGSGCASTPGQRPFSPALSAGTESSKAGASTPFVMKFTRNDGEQELSALDLTTPKGFSAKLAGVPYCSDAAIAAGAGKSGASEQASPSCPAASRIGTLAATAGPGPNPYRVNGTAYLAGPYKGAPLSFVFIAPAVAGPFDLGNVVVRAAVFVHPETAQMKVSSDPLPRILDGMPLRLRSIVARIDRPDFTRNPTSCEPMAVNATVAGSNGAGASPSTAFQVGGCKDLAFKPKLALALLGPTRRSAHPRLRATLTPRPDDANIARAAITLPATELLEGSHIRSVCSRARFDAGTCPRGSVYGRAEATSPLLDGPLRGPVYLRNNPAHRLPDLVASLDGQVHVDVAAGLDSSRGRIRAAFATPDLPLRRLTLTLSGGDRGLIVNTGGLCGAKPPRARAGFTAQSGATHSASPRVRTDCAPRHPGSR
jgi:hypothetical protein